MKGWSDSNLMQLRYPAFTTSNMLGVKNVIDLR